MMPSAVFLLLQALSAPVQASALDTMVDVDGYRMHLVLYRGRTPRTLVMESGGGAALDESWLALEARLAARTGATVVAYERAGFGKSGTGPPGLTPRQQVQHLDDALQKLATPPQRVLVGTSYGGLLAVLHGHLYPDKVRGLALVDPMNPRFVQATGEFVQSTAPHIAHPTTSRDTALLRMVETFDELVHDPDASDIGLGMPMVIVTAGEAWWGRRDIDRAWRESHQAMAGAGPNRCLVIAEGSNHDIAAKRPQTIIDAVLSLVRRP
jgi:pimeloyl-ACP methyl ester carboxylesterase